MMASVATETVLRQPDIAYTPDFDKYQARTRLRLTTEPLKEEDLPSGFPRELKSDFVWEGEGLAEKYDWTFVLTDEHIEELETALAHFKCESSRYAPIFGRLVTVKQP